MWKEYEIDSFPWQKYVNISHMEFGNEYNFTPICLIHSLLNITTIMAHLVEAANCIML